MRGISRADFAGASVALSRDGTTLIFGAPEDSDFMTYGDPLGMHDYEGTPKGYLEVHAFDAVDQSWNQLGSRLEGDENHQRHGHSVAINANGSRHSLREGWVTTEAWDT